MLIQYHTARRRPVIWGKIIKVFSITLAFVVVFFAGVGVGSGQLFFNSSGRTSMSKDLPENLDYLSVEEVYDSLRYNFDGQLDQSKILDGLKEGIARASGDPYTEYFNQEASKEFEEQLNGSFEGIGAELSKEGPNIIVVSPIAGFPAEQAGIRPGDIIAKINDQSAYDMTVGAAVKIIRGPKGTKVKLTVIRAEQVLNFEITRSTITIPSVKSEVLDGGIGYIAISRFGDDTAGLARQAATDLKTRGVKAVILDLRGNPGGLLESSVSVAGLWLKNKVVLEEKRGSETIKTHTAGDNPVLLGMPTVVMIDSGSASASEIVAGALKDHQAAKILGVKSFGKGSVQELRNLRGGGVLKVTIARWYTPNGRNIDKDGIEPDQAVEISEADIKAKRDPQKEAAISELK